MARIVSKLNLNKTPQLVESNSMIFAKNIKLLKDGSIGQDDSILPLDFNTENLTRDINNIISNLRNKIEYWEDKIQYYREQDSEVDIVQIYKDYITNNRFTNYGYITSGYQYTGGDTFYNLTFVLDNNNPGTSIPHQGNNILESDAIAFFNELNSTSHTELGFPLIPKALFEHYGDIISGAPHSYYDNFDYDKYYKAITSINDSTSPNYDSTWYEEHIEQFPNNYPADYPKQYNGTLHFTHPLYGWMIAWFLLTHGQQIQKLVSEAIHQATLDDNIIESQIKLLEGYIAKAEKDIEYYTNSLNNISNIDNYTIVGVIPYNTQFYLFLYNEGSSIILKYDEKEGFSICNCNWNYNGGIIDGNCVINLNGDVLLNIAEYKDDNTLLVPIKTINLTESDISDDESIYTQVPRVHFLNLNFVEYYNNNIPTGTYQFFIRYEIRDNFYTNWFPASKELFAGTVTQQRTKQGTLQYVDTSIDSGSSFHFKVDKVIFNPSLNFKSFQIGFILSHDDTVYARAWKKFNLDTTDVYFDYQKEYIEELNIEDLLNVPYGVFNVKNITNFKNKLYISNYIESDFNPDLEDYIYGNVSEDNLVDVKIKVKSRNTESDTYCGYPITYDTQADKKYIDTIDGISIENIVAELLRQAKSYVDRANERSTTYTYKGVTLEVKYRSEGFSQTYQYTIHEQFGPGVLAESDNYNDIISYISGRNVYVGENGRFYYQLPTTPDDSYDSSYLLYVRAKANYLLSFSITPSNLHFSYKLKKVETTLMPGQEYAYYIHFVKDTGEYTNGYKIGSSFIDIEHANNAKIGRDNFVSGININDSIEQHKIFYPIFTFNKTLPKGYVACFISIVHTKYNTSEIFNTHDGIGPNGDDDVNVGDNLDLDIREYKDFDELPYTLTGGAQTNVCKYYPSYDNTNWNTFGGSGKVVPKGSATFEENKQYFILLEHESNEKYIQLQRITPYIVVPEEDYTYDNYEDLNLFSYICEVVKLKDNFVFYTGGTEVYKKNTDFGTGNESLDELQKIDFEAWLNGVSIDNLIPIYSNFNLNYLTLTLDLNPRIFSKTYDSETPPTVRGIVISLDSMTLSDIYELKAMYKDYTRKFYQPYNEKAIIKFENTVRSSILEGDEAKVNVFRFKATDYYNVPTDKGIIINMKAVGESILVHTQDSMFRFSGANSLSSAGGEEVAMKEGEPFDTGIQEIFGSEYGFAGLQRKEQHTITENGYTFYDSDSNTLYIYGGQQQVFPISDDINKLLNRAPIEDISFANDYYNDRIFVQIKFEDGFFATLSFNFRVKSFISLHDFKFDKSFNTKTKCYFIRQNKIYVIKKSTQRTYDALRAVDNLYPCKDSFHFNQHGIYFDSSDKCSIVDIIFKEDYSNVKTLNAISWVCNKILGFTAEDKLYRLFVAEENLAPYAGGFLRIYTDSTATDLIEIYKESNPYSFNTVKTNDTPPKLLELREEQRRNYSPKPYVNIAGYVYPRFNLGQWTFNYFRNILNTTDVTNSNSASDNKSLIYGKYIVVRFVFSNSDNFKLEDITFNIAPFK